jgi:hypothetical protein
MMEEDTSHRMHGRGGMLVKSLVLAASSAVMLIVLYNVALYLRLFQVPPLEPRSGLCVAEGWCRN